ncbi:MAG: GAF domain-containing protein [Elusimicrobia bacterium]|nr:GAF domain-containing protein [Elusimicrobiota bacterium]
MTEPSSAQENLKDRPSRARYNKVHHALDTKWRRRTLEAERMMREVVDELWDQFAQSPYSWCGFYILEPAKEQLTVGPHRDKPACSPLPLHGVCGKVAQSGKPLIVPDVRALGQAHIVCDPKNLSEIALPVFDSQGKVWAVLDVDSEELGAFDTMDQRWLERILKPFQDIGKD